MLFDKLFPRTIRARIGIIDKSPHFSHGLKQMLTAVGHIVVLDASDEENFLHIVKTLDQHPQLIILDVDMPDKDFPQIIQQLLQAVTGAKILLLTMNKKYPDLKALIEGGGGASGFIYKNADVEVFQEAIRRIIGGKIFLPDLGTMLLAQKGIL